MNFTNKEFSCNILFCVLKCFSFTAILIHQFWHLLDKMSLIKWINRCLFIENVIGSQVEIFSSCFLHVDRLYDAVASPGSRLRSPNLLAIKLQNYSHTNLPLLYLAPSALAISSRQAVPLDGSIPPNTQASRWFPISTILSGIKWWESFIWNRTVSACDSKFDESSTSGHQRKPWHYSNLTIH